MLVCAEFDGFRGLYPSYDSPRSTPSKTTPRICGGWFIQPWLSAFAALAAAG